MITELKTIYTCEFCGSSSEDMLKTKACEIWCKAAKEINSRNGIHVHSSSKPPIY